MPSIKVPCICDAYIEDKWLKPESGSSVNENADKNFGRETELKLGYQRYYISGFKSAESWYSCILQFDISNTNLYKKRVKSFKLYMNKKSGSIYPILRSNLYFYKGIKNVEYEVTWNNIEIGEIEVLLGSRIEFLGDIEFQVDGDKIYAPMSDYLTFEEIRYPFLSLFIDSFDVDNLGIFYSKEGGEGAYIEFEYEEIIPGIPVIDYPDQIQCRNNSRIIFSWLYQATDGIDQAAYEIGWHVKGAATWNTVTGNTNKKYHEFSENTFPNGEIEWRLRTYNAYGNVSDYAYATFLSIGESAAPKIVSVKNDAFTEIIWEAPEQDLFEILIYSGKEEIHNSGIQIGYNIYNYSPGIMLKDGSYALKMRMINIYGVYTDWTNYAFIIDTAKPKKPIVYASINNKYSVKIRGSIDTEKAYIVRKNIKNAKEEILTEYVEGEYIDYTAASGQTYAYLIRAYENGYTDSDEAIISMDFSGIIVCSKANTEKNIELYLSEEQYIKIGIQNGKETRYIRCVGRKYPILEKTEWISKEITVTCYINKAEYAILENFFYENEIVLLKLYEQVMYCDISSLSITNTLFNKGFSLDVTFTIVDLEEL